MARTLRESEDGEERREKAIGSFYTYCTTLQFRISSKRERERGRDLTLLGFVSSLKRCRYPPPPPLLLLYSLTLSVVSVQPRLCPLPAVTWCIRKCDISVFSGTGETRVRPSWLSGNVKAWLEQLMTSCDPTIDFIKRTNPPGSRTKPQNSPARPAAVSPLEMQHENAGWQSCLSSLNTWTCQRRIKPSPSQLTTPPIIPLVWQPPSIKPSPVKSIS